LGGFNARADKSRATVLMRR